MNRFLLAAAAALCAAIGLEFAGCTSASAEANDSGILRMCEASPGTSKFMNWPGLRARARSDDESTRRKTPSATSSLLTTSNR